MNDLLNAIFLFVENTSKFGECPLFYDEVLCWPPTAINSTHSIPCTIALQTLLNEYHIISEDGKRIKNEQRTA